MNDDSSSEVHGVRGIAPVRERGLEESEDVGEPGSKKPRGLGGAGNLVATSSKASLNESGEPSREGGFGAARGEVRRLSCSGERSLGSCNRI